MKKINTLNTTIFSIFLGAVMIINILSPTKDFSEMENRYLAQLPKFTLRNLRLGRVTTGIEEFVTDQFFFREKWVLFKSDMERLSLRRENNGIFIGREGFLLENYKGPNNNLANNIDRVNEIANLIPEIEVYFLIAPNSFSVHGDKLPFLASNYDEREVIKQIQTTLDGEIVFINPMDYLISRNDQYLYFRTDHHWTMLGAYWAYHFTGQYMGFAPYDLDDFNKVLKSEDFLGTYFSKANNRGVMKDHLYVYKPDFNVDYKLTLNGVDASFSGLYNDEHLIGRDKYSCFLDGNHPLTKLESHVNNGKKLLVIKDSYAHNYVPFIANHYEEIHMVDLRYFTLGLNQYVLENDITEVLFLYNLSTFSQDGTITQYRK